MNTGDGDASTEADRTSAMSGVKRKYSESPSRSDGDDNNDSNEEDDSETESMIQEVLEEQHNTRTKELSLTGMRNNPSDRLFFLDVVGEMDEIWPVGSSSPDVLKAIKMLERLPYVAGCLKPRLDEANELLSTTPSSSSRLRAELSREEKQVLDNLKDEKFKEMFLRELQEKLLSEARGKMVSTLNSVQVPTGIVRQQLQALAGLSQAEGTFTRTSQRASQSESVTSRGFNVLETQKIYSVILTNSVDIRDKLPDLSKQPSDEIGQKLQSVAHGFDGYQSEATFLTSEAKGYKMKVLNEMALLRQHVCPMSAQPDKNKSQSRQDGSPKARDAPGAWAHEVDGTQPYVQLLLEAIGECWETSVSSSGSPAKSSVRKEAAITGTEYRRKRTMDFLLQKEGRWNSVIFDDTLTVPMEVKPGSRTSQGPTVLLDEARDQVLSRLAKHLFIGFNFAGFGVPCHSTGIVANMAAVQILQLRYENVGTMNAKLTLYKSDFLPLMTLKNYKRWAQSADTKAKEFRELEEKLFGPERKGGIGESGVPMGMQALFNLIGQLSRKLRGLSVDADNEILGDLLGTGATAVVFRRGGASAARQDSVVKISKFGFGKYIANELRILRQLADNGQGSENRHLPKIVPSDVTDNVQLKTKLGDVCTPLHAIEMSPVGKDAKLVFSTLSSGQSMDANLQLVYSGIMSALNHLHSMKICHFDVSPKNIIIADNGARAVLIDFSISDKCEKSIKGFRGTPNYVHREVFRCYLHNGKEWNALPHHDKAGLGFTLAFFANRCVRSWDVDGFPKRKRAPKVEEEELLVLVMETRLDHAKTAVENCAIKKDIEGLLHCDYK